MIEDFVNDYAKYLKVDLQNEFHDVQDTIDDMLTRLDEFENLVNMVKTDNELCADISIPIVLHAKKKLDLLCDQIDALEKVVSCAKSDVDLIEMQVEEAEEVLSNQPSGKLKNILKPLFFVDIIKYKSISSETGRFERFVKFEKKHVQWKRSLDFINAMAEIISVSMNDPKLTKKSPNEVPMRRHSKTLATYEAPTLFTTSSFFPSQNEESLHEKQNVS